MAELPDIQFQPPKSWELFESLIRDLYRDRWKDKDIQKNGRPGQVQNGVDIFGHDNGSPKTSGVQNKEKDLYPRKKLTLAEVKEELKKAETFEPELEHYEIATTALRDAKMQKDVRLLNKEQRSLKKLEVRITFWEDIVEMIKENPDVAKKYYSAHYDVDDVNQAKLEKSIEKAKTLMDNLALDSAMAKLLEIKADEWSSLNENLKFKLLTNLANVEIRKANVEEGADYFIEAFSHLPEEEKAITNLAWAYNLRERFDESTAILESLLKNSPGNEIAWTNLISTNPDISLDEALKLIPAHLHKKYPVSLTFAELATKEAKFEIAEKYAREALAVADTKLGTHNANVMLADALKFQAHTEGDSVSLSQLSKEALGKLEDSMTHLVMAWDIVKDTEAAKYFTYAGIQAMHIYRLVGDTANAIKLSEEILKVSDEPDAHIMLGMAAGSNIKDVIKHYEAAAKSGVVNARMLLAEAYDDSGESIKALEIFTALMDEVKDGKLRRHIIQLQSATQQKLGLFQDALKTSEDYLKEDKRDVMMLVQHAYVIKALEGDEKFQNELRAAVKIAKDAPPVDLLMLGDALYRAGMFVEARDIYLLLVNTDIDSDLHRRLIDCYYKIGDNKEALRLASNLIEKYGPLPFVSELQTYIYESIEDLDKAKEACLSYLAKYKDDFSMQLRLAILNSRLKKFDELDKFLNDFDDFDSIKNEKDILPFVQLLQDRGFKDKARDLLYQYREKTIKKSETHATYVTYFMMYERESEPFDVSEVEIYTEVTVDDGKTEVKYFLTDGETDVTKHILNISEPIAKKLLGKKVGDEVDLGNNEEKQTVKSIKNKYIVALHESLEILGSIYPDNGAVRKVSFDTENPEESIEKLLKTVDERRKAVEIIEKSYSENKATIGGFAKQVGKNIVEVFYTLQGKGLKSKINVFSEPNTVIERASKIVKPVQLILDATAIVTVTELGFGEKLIEEFGKFGVSRATISEFEQHLATLKSVGKDGYSTMSSENGKLVLENITKEVIDIKIELIESIIDFIQKNGETLPVNKALDIKAERLKDLNRVLGESSVSSILLASEEGRMLYSEDNILRKIAEQEFDVEAIWTQPILMYLRDLKLISEQEYNSNVIQLVRRNYSYTSFDNSVLMSAADASDWKLVEPLISMLDVFSDPMLSDDSLVRLASTFLYSLWKHPTANVIERDAILAHTVQNLLRRNQPDKVINSLKTHVSQVFKSWSSAKSEVLDAIDTVSKQ